MRSCNQNRVKNEKKNYQGLNISKLPLCAPTFGIFSKAL